MSKNKKQKKAASKPAKAKPAKKVKVEAKKVAKKAAPVKATKALKKPAKVLTSPAKKEVAAVKPGKVKQVLPLANPVVVEEVQEEVALTNADGKRYCKVSDCDEVEAIDSYCRLHYIMYWKRNKTKGKILEGGKLDKYIDELTARYPDKYLEMLKKDLSSEKEFNGIISEMDAEDAADDADSEEEDNRFIEEVRGTVPTGSDDSDDY